MSKSLSPNRTVVSGRPRNSVQNEVGLPDQGDIDSIDMGNVK